MSDTTTYQTGTETIGESGVYSVRVSCSCHVCEQNAARLGKTLPLVAWIQPKAADGLKITPKNADRASKVHGIVYMAHEPAMGRAQRMAIADAELVREGKA